MAIRKRGRVRREPRRRELALIEIPAFAEILKVVLMRPNPLNDCRAKPLSAIREHFVAGMNTKWARSVQIAGKGPVAFPAGSLESWKIIDARAKMHEPMPAKTETLNGGPGALRPCPPRSGRQSVVRGQLLANNA